MTAGDFSRLNSFIANKENNLNISNISEQSFGFEEAAGSEFAFEGKVILTSTKDDICD